VIACCNAEGKFLPPIPIWKGINKKHEFWNGLHHGSEVYIKTQVSCINSALSLKRFREHFIPRKPLRKSFLIFNGHAFKLLELADSHHVTIYSPLIKSYNSGPSATGPAFLQAA
jgi:hypothetical protein